MVRRVRVGLLILAAAAWSGGWLYVFQHQYRLQRVCDLFAGPWLPCGPHEWQAPLMLALAGPLALAAIVVGGFRSYR